MEPPTRYRQALGPADRVPARRARPAVQDRLPVLSRRRAALGIRRPALGGALHGLSQITAADKPEIKKLAEYAAKREPIPWARVYKLPEFTYFPHKAHIRAEVACQTCHGPVETMTTAAATTGPTLTNDLLNLVGLRPAPPPLTMGWCVDCHRQQNATRGTQAPLDCVMCHH